MENKQTAVEWLAEQYEKDGYLGIQRIEQAKEMEKEQMRLADKNGQDRNQYKHDCEYGGVEYWDNEPKPFEEYYNETFKSNNNG
jgi:hypothetical protein